MKHHLYADTAQARETDRLYEQQAVADDPWPPLTPAELEQQAQTRLQDRQRSAARVREALGKMEAFFTREAPCD